MVLKYCTANRLNMQGAQKIQDNPAFSSPADVFRQGAREPLSSMSMLAGIGLLAPPGMNALSALEPGVRDAQVQELLMMNSQRIKDAERQGLSYSSALWEDILGVHGTGSKRGEGPWEKRAEGVIAVAGAREVFKSVYDGARDSYAHAAKSGLLGPLGEGVKSANSQAARDFAANALNEACSESVSSRDTLSQFAALANGNIERSLYGQQAQAQRLPVSLGMGLAVPEPIGLQGYRQIEISTAQALIYYFQEHPEEYDDVMTFLGS